MAKKTDAPDRLAEDALTQLTTVRPSGETLSAAVAAAALLSRRTTEELSDRDRVTRICRREGATRRGPAEPTGLSRGTIAAIGGDAK
jgi:hypothetical protein